MPLSFSSFRNEEKYLLNNKKAFYDALGMAQPVAIRALAGKISFNVKQAAKQAGLMPEDAEELLNDAVFITISNIRDGSFEFDGVSPAAYANGVVRKLISGRLRSKKTRQEELKDYAHASSFDPETYLNDKELETIMGQLLGKLEENCRNLLRLKYFENLRDKEIIEQKLTPYTTTTSLKSRRNQCLNKLIEIAKATGLLDDYQ